MSVNAAILALMEQQKLIAEGAGAVAVAGAMFNKVPVAGKKTICVVSGGNIDVTILSRVIGRGLDMSGRSYTVTLDLHDKPGELMGVATIVARLGGNIISVLHERNNNNTRNAEHISLIRNALLEAGYTIVN